MNAVIAYVSQSDLRLSRRVRGWTPPRWVRLWMLWATKLGDGWLWLGLGVALLAGGSRFHRILAAAAIAAGGANIALVVIKRRFRRRRPCDEAPHPAFALRPSGFVRYVPSDRFSFPSGHAMNAFALATVLGLAFPWAASLLALVAASVAVSRVVLGFHFLSDVVAGSLLGALIGATSYVLVLA
jgi:undecaprenyl-diphosphatase